MPSRWRETALLGLPLLAVVSGFLLWRTHGFERLNEWESPLALWMNSLTGRSDFFDLTVIFLNNWWGEALCVLAIFTVYALMAARFMAKPTDWRRVAMFAGLIFVVWVFANSVGDRLEPVFERPSPSIVIGEPMVNLEERHQRKVKTASHNSFPSNHGSVFFTVFFMCLLRWRGMIRESWYVWLSLFVLAALLSTPRVFTGAHWMTDTLIGSVLVTWLVAALVMHTPAWTLYQRIEDRLIPVFDRWMGINRPS